MSRKVKDDKPLAKKRTFYLPGDLDEWMEKKADGDKRSVSNYLVLLIERDKAQQVS